MTTRPALQGGLQYIYPAGLLLVEDLSPNNISKALVVHSSSRAQSVVSKKAKQMAPEWEAMGVDLGIGVNTSTAMPPSAPPSSMSHFFFPAAGAEAPPPASGSSFNLSFADDFSIPMQSEEAAELEWLSNFIDDSYPDMPNYPPEVAAAAKQQPLLLSSSSSSSSSSSMGSGSTGARTKRSRATSSSSSWLISGSLSQSQTIISRSNKNQQGGDDSSDNNNGGGGGCVRRCTHCASEKTPQWRTGPLGPKTLCNACGVRYKSGRLVPEYRPAASPTFVLTQHSNSHRKVMELRRQKELIHIRGSSSSFPDYAGGLC
ncbi:hypothetical protein QOZ80_3BG0297680 [Eleusine coracana subsp. coracana]|nr:hypothetical protein QOZ80_3BG0297680 [Eleusine coracana subsp. coracana]